MKADTVAIEELLGRKFSKFSGVRAKKTCGELSLSDFVEEVKGEEHADSIAEIRGESDQKKRDQLKKKLPAASISGICEDGRGGSNGVTKHSGLLQVDFDLKDNPDFRGEEIRGKLTADPCVAVAFESPSGGMKAVCPISRDKELHKGCFAAAQERFEALGLKMDNRPSNPKSLCFLSHDPNAWVADGVVDLLYSIQVNGEREGCGSGACGGKRTRVTTGKASAITLLPARAECEKRLKRWLKKAQAPEALLWRKRVQDRYEPDFSRRNEMLVDLVTYLFHRVGDEGVLAMAEAFHFVYSPFFRDSLAQHMREARSQLGGRRAQIRLFLGRGGGRGLFGNEAR